MGLIMKISDDEAMEALYLLQRYSAQQGVSVEAACSALVRMAMRKIFADHNIFMENLHAEASSNLDTQSYQRRTD